MRLSGHTGHRPVLRQKMQNQDQPPSSGALPGPGYLFFAPWRAMIV